MAGSNGKRGLSRDEVAELYGEVRKAMTKLKSGEVPKGKIVPGSAANSEAAKQIAAEIKKAMARDPQPTEGSTSTKSRGPASFGSSVSPEGTMSSMAQSAPASVPPSMRNGRMLAVSLVMFFGVARVMMTALESFGIMGPAIAEASIAPAPQAAGLSGFSREEVRVLSSLDSRRAELAERAKSLDDRQNTLDVRDREFAVRVAQLKELTDKLKLERDKGQKQKNAQIDQLANVYGAMAPQEAAQLIEQLDVQIALSLVERMPEKRIGQILALMSKERALLLTKMLSGKVG